MSQAIARARESFAPTQLTLISLFQAIVLEALVSRTAELTAPQLSSGWTWSLALQAGVMFVTVVGVWIGFATLLSVARWSLRTPDLVGPFLIGVTQLLAIQLMGPSTLPLFFGLVGLGFVGAIVANVANQRALASDPVFLEASSEYRWAAVRAANLAGMAAAGLGAAFGVFGLGGDRIFLVGMGAAVLTIIGLQLAWWNQLVAKDAAE